MLVKGFYSKKRIKKLYFYLLLIVLCKYVKMVKNVYGTDKVMKIKQFKVSYDDACAIKMPGHKEPNKPNIFFRTLLKIVSLPDLIATRFSYEKIDMEKAGKGPYLIFMNHSSFIDLEIAASLFYPKPMCIVSTFDSYVGKAWLMRRLGCIPTQKFVSDITLIKDMSYAIKEKKTSVLMYPEAGYTIDGRATAIPKKMGILIKKLDVPVVYVKTEGAFARDPLYNGLQKRKVKVSAEVKCLLSKEKIKEKSIAEIDAILDEAFSFDSFKWQKDNKIKIDEPFRADGLERILYKCAACGAEGKTEGKGVELVCHACGKKYTLTEYGELQADDGNTEFSHIPDWYDWQRAEVRRELEAGTYKLDTEVDIGILANYKGIYMVGEGRLTHGENGFVLDGCDGKLHYEQSPLFSYSLNSDFFWYEIGDVISIGDKNRLFYLFPKQKNVVLKARLACEELYKIKTPRRNTKGEE